MPVVVLMLIRFRWLSRLWAIGFLNEDSGRKRFAVRVTKLQRLASFWIDQFDTTARTPG